MLKLPATLIQPFDDLLLSKSLSDKDRAFYKKWLCFYWDFCHKYRHDAFHSGSLPLFIQKLQDKNQSVQQQNQAKQAVNLFYELRAGSEQTLVKHKNVSIPTGQGVEHTEVATDHSNHQHDPMSKVEDPVRQRSYDQPSLPVSSVNLPIKETGTSWVFVFDQLVNEIKIRHYSPKTLKAYRGYIRQFQTFTKSKAYQTLSQQDVIDFLTFLAV